LAVNLWAKNDKNRPFTTSSPSKTSKTRCHIQSRNRKVTPNGFGDVKAHNYRQCPSSRHVTVQPSVSMTFDTMQHIVHVRPRCIRIMARATDQMPPNTITTVELPGSRKEEPGENHTQLAQQREMGVGIEQANWPLGTTLPSRFGAHLASTNPLATTLDLTN
jgi:hypothetical protein